MADRDDNHAWRTGALNGIPADITERAVEAGRRVARAQQRKQRRDTPDELRIVFDGPPGPQPGRFVEVEDEHGRSVRAGEWVERDDGLWELRIRPPTTRYDCEGCGEVVADTRNALTPVRTMLQEEWAQVAAADAGVEDEIDDASSGLDQALSHLHRLAGGPRGQEQGGDAYRERAKAIIVLALLADREGHEVWWADDPKEPGWPVLFIQLPTGQVTWHFSPDDAEMVTSRFGRGSNVWDGHDSDTKWERAIQWPAQPQEQPSEGVPEPTQAPGPDGVCPFCGEAVLTQEEAVAQSEGLLRRESHLTRCRTQRWWSTFLELLSTDALAAYAYEDVAEQATLAVNAAADHLTGGSHGE